MLKFLKKRHPKLLVVGLDGFAPDLVLSKWRNQLPTFNRLMTEGAFGTLQSSVPCVSIPAWNVMTAGKDAGTIGLYGEKNHGEGSYDDVQIAFGSASREPAVWEILGEAGKRVVTMGVPGTYPPQLVNGVQISCHLTPQTLVTGANQDQAAKFTYPQELGAKVNQWTGGAYPVDIVTDTPQPIEEQIQQIYQMTDQHFQVMRKLLKQQIWDFFISVEIGASRLHQRVWGEEQDHLPNEKIAFEQVILDYYTHIDSHLEQLIAQLDGDTAIMIVSDRGVQRAAGSICVNDWLVDEEWLALVDGPIDHVQAFRADDVNWQKTLAWAEGGEFTRFFLNVEGREPQGLIPWSSYLDMRDELIAKILDVRGPSGERLNTQIFKPEETFRHLHGTVPDLIVYWDDLRWQATDDLGHPTIWTNVGEAGAAPTPNGLYIYWHPRQKFNGTELFGWEVLDVAPTILDYFQLPMPIEMQGRKIPLTLHDVSAAPTPTMMDLQGHVQPKSAPRRQRRRKPKPATYAKFT
ncbi:hypothetical protein GC175_10825 [bacterium]|nr:hypothetical protein [bacterium]